MGNIQQEQLKLVIFNSKNCGNNPDFQKLLTSLPKYCVVDEIAQQLEEIYYIRHPQTMLGNANPVDVKKYTSELIDNINVNEFGIWVYYPWNNHIVHFLPEDLHTELRTSRNRNLITVNEQSKYYQSSVGVAGLSIGNSVVGTLLHTGGSKYMRLADFDTLSASNTNRIRTSFINLGVKKTTIAAQEIYEVNPYAQLKLYSGGINNENLESFLNNPRKLDVLIEEMDNIYLKIQIRLLARQNRIPVVMATDNGDNIILDIERYDLDQNYPLLHGDISEKELLLIKPNTPKPITAKIITRWVHPENVAFRMQKSLLELGKTLYTWPQLGTAAFLSGCAVSYAVRSIIVGEHLESGKYKISLDQGIGSSFENDKNIL
jgi:molybdopterin/thiamine biosynthesis adenylyltransferase